MAVTYVSDFTFPADFGFHKNGSASVPGKKHGGHVSTPQRYKAGGQAKVTHGNDANSGMGAGKEHLKGGSPAKNADHKFAGTRTEKSSGVQKPAFKDGGKVAHGKQWDGQKKPWNMDDSVSPGSANRPAPKQGMKNSAAARDKFATDGENTDPATKQTGEVQRMSGFSDFKHGGKVHKKKMGGSAKCYAKGGQVTTEDRYETGETHKVSAPDSKVKGDGMAYKKGGRISNLGHYAHGGKVGAKYEKAAGTPKTSPKAHAEVKSGNAEGKHTMVAQGTKKHNGKAPLHEKHLASGGLGRATSHKKNAAIHAKNKHQGPSLGALASVLGGAGQMGAPHQPPGPGIGAGPPGMAPGMGGPPGGQVGGMAPPPGMGMSHGGGVKHVIVHHVSHKA